MSSETLGSCRLRNLLGDDMVGAYFVGNIQSSPISNQQPPPSFAIKGPSRHGKGVGDGTSSLTRHAKRRRKRLCSSLPGTSLGLTALIRAPGISKVLAWGEHWCPRWPTNPPAAGRHLQLAAPPKRHIGGVRWPLYVTDGSNTNLSVAMAHPCIHDCPSVYQSPAHHGAAKIATRDRVSAARRLVSIDIK